MMTNIKCAEGGTFLNKKPDICAGLINYSSVLYPRILIKIPITIITKEMISIFKPFWEVQNRDRTETMIMARPINIISISLLRNFFFVIQCLRLI